MQNVFICTDPQGAYLASFARRETARESWELTYSALNLRIYFDGVCVKALTNGQDRTGRPIEQNKILGFVHESEILTKADHL